MSSDLWHRERTGEMDRATSFTNTPWIEASWQFVHCWKERREIGFLSCGSGRKFNTAAVSDGSLAGSGISISKYERLEPWNTRSSNTNDSWILLGAWKQVRNNGFQKGACELRAAVTLDQFRRSWEDKGLECERWATREKGEMFLRHEEGLTFTPLSVPLLPGRTGESPKRR